MENPIEMDDLGVPLFSETPIWGEDPKKGTPTCDVNSLRITSSEALEDEDHDEAESYPLVELKVVVTRRYCFGGGRNTKQQPTTVLGWC